MDYNIFYITVFCTCTPSNCYQTRGNTMKKSVFRNESLDRVNSPEELNEYIKVTSPSVWIVLTAIVLLLVGFIVFACFAEVDGVRLISFVIN